MGVLLGGTAVGRPASMPHPDPQRGEVPVALGEGAGEVFQPPDLSYLLDPAILEQGQPGRIVPTILEVPETLHEHLHTTFPAHVTHDAAHGPTSLSIHRWNPGG